jgi:hypothetical protein
MVEEREKIARGFEAVGTPPKALVLKELEVGCCRSS